MMQIIINEDDGQAVLLDSDEKQVWASDADQSDPWAEGFPDMLEESDFQDIEDYLRASGYIPKRETVEYVIESDGGEEE